MAIFESDLCQSITREMCSEYKPGSVHWVRVTHVTNPHNFYVRPIKYNCILGELESNIHTAEMRDINSQQFVVFKSNLPKIQRIIRGQIMGTNNKPITNSCDVFALDYGFLEKAVAVEDIYNCDENILNIPALALQCQLDMCAPIGGGDWSNESIEALKYYFGDEKAKIIVKYNVANKLIIEMFNTCPDDIATLMALTGYSTLGYVDNEVSRVPTVSTSIGAPNENKK